MISLQQLSPHGMGNTADEENQDTPKTFNPNTSHHFETVIMQDSPSDPSSDLDKDSDSLNYKSPLPVVMKINGEGNLQVPITL